MTRCSGKVERLLLLGRSLLGGSSFGAHVAVTTGTNMLLALLGLVTGALAARLLGPGGRGELAAIQMWPGVLCVVASLGLPQALTFYSAQSARTAGRYLASATSLSLLASLPFLVLGYLALPVVLSAQSPAVIAASRWYLLLLLIQAVVPMPYHVLRGRSDFTVWNILRLAPGLGWLVILAGCWLSGRADPRTAAFAYLAVLAGLSIPSYAVVLRRVAPPFLPDPREWRSMLSYGLPSMLTGVPQLLNLRLDQMLMAAFLPTQTLGLYVVAVTWSGAVAQLPNALGAVLLPRTASQQTTAQRDRVFAQGSRLAVLTALSVAAGILLVTPLAIPLIFGERFRASVSAALVLVGAAAIAAVNNVLEEGLRGLGRPAVCLWAETAGLGVTAVSLLLLLPALQIMGAAIASVLGYGTVTLVLVAFSTRLTGNSIVTLLWPERRDLEHIQHALRFATRGRLADPAS